MAQENTVQTYAAMLKASKNLILRGAPGTGKSYLAKQIAKHIISNGKSDKYTDLTNEEKKQLENQLEEQMEFVQFHPSYDYSDFVGGLRPKIDSSGTMVFRPQDGIFKRFVDNAKKNFEDLQKTIEKENLVQKAINEFINNIESGITTFKTKNGTEFKIMDINVNDKYIYISIPENAKIKELTLNLDRIQEMLESGEEFNEITKDIKKFLEKTYTPSEVFYEFAIYREILKILKQKNLEIKKEKPYIFIIDEINRGEISKIFGELFFSIDPGYRGKAGEISTQYANMHSNSDEKFYIPENVYIIGTMNDIDRSVDSFDFAMRRRFRFVEVTAEDSQKMLDALKNESLKKEAIKRMNALNKEIANTPDLDEDYQIGASYFLKLNEPDFNFILLWEHYLKPLLQEYVRGMSEEEKLMNKFKTAYYSQSTEKEEQNPNTGTDQPN